MVKELPPAKDGDWQHTIERVNQLFRKTHEIAGGMQEEIFRKTSSPEPLKKSSKKAAKGRAAEGEIDEPEFKPRNETFEPEITAKLEPEPVTEVAEPPIAVETQPEPVMEVAEPEPEPVIETESVTGAGSEPDLEAVAEPEPEPVLEIESETAQMEPEPMTEAVEPEMIAQAEPEPQLEDLEYEFDFEAEQAPQAFGEDAVVTVEDTVEEAEEEEPVKVISELDKERDEQIERLFKRIQPIELKPPPNSAEAAKKGFFSKLFRRDKTPV